MQLAFLIIVLVFGLALFFFLEKASWRISPAERQDFEKKWQKIKMMAEEDDMERAILEGDKLIDLILRKKKIQGKTGNERLNHARKFFSNFKGLKQAHYIRNQIAHEASFVLSRGAGREAFKNIERAVRDLKVI
jgi:hypothetical protein